MKHELIAELKNRNMRIIAFTPTPPGTKTTSNGGLLA
jgi:hypothetical protein